MGEEESHRVVALPSARRAQLDRHAVALVDRQYGAVGAVGVEAGAGRAERQRRAARAAARAHHPHLRLRSLDRQRAPLVKVVADQLEARRRLASARLAQPRRRQ